MNKREGKGTLTFTDGTVYTGDFRDNHFEGMGRYSDINGNVYEGQFVKDKLNGQATYSNSEGDKFVGTWKDDLKHGELPALLGYRLSHLSLDLHTGHGKYLYASGGE